MRILVLALLAFALMLGGCATQKTVDMAKSYNEAYEKHTEQEAEKVESKAEAIKDVLAYDCEDGTEACGVAKALSGVVASIQISNIKSDPFTLEKHATDVDAQIVGMKELGSGVPFLSNTVVSVAAIEADKGSVVNSADNGSTVNNTLDEDHTTNLGDESTVTSMPDNSTVAEEEAEE